MAYKKYDAYHLGMQPEEVKDALQGGGSASNRELYVGGAADKFTMDGQDLVALTDKAFSSSAEATAYIKNFIEQNVTTVFLNLKGAPNPFGEMGHWTFILQSIGLFNEPTQANLIYSSGEILESTLQGHFNTYEVSGKYYAGIVLSFVS